MRVFCTLWDAQFRLIPANTNGSQDCLRGCMKSSGTRATGKDLCCLRRTTRAVIVEGVTKPSKGVRTIAHRAIRVRVPQGPFNLAGVGTFQPGDRRNRLGETWSRRPSVSPRAANSSTMKGP